MHEIEDTLGGPDPDSGVCMSCEGGDMYNTGIYGGTY